MARGPDVILTKITCVNPKLQGTMDHFALNRWKIFHKKFEQSSKG